MLSALFDELRRAPRTLSANPGFTLLVVGVMASGLACVIFMLGLINGFVLRPLPFPQPERLLHAGYSDGSNHNGLDEVSARDLLQIRRALDGKAQVAGLQQATVNLTDLERPERYDGAMVSANLWHVLGQAPILGRDLLASDEQPGAAPVALISYDLWQSRYGGAADIVGRAVRINSRPGAIVGVMPRDLSYPYREMIWIPATLREDVPDPDNDYALVLRREAAVSPAAIGSTLDAWFETAARADPERLRGQRIVVEPLAYYSVNRITRAVLGIMLAAVVLVLLVACANAANLLLLRTLGRRQELAVRVALGASRGRIALHLLVQSLMLALVAVAIALPLAAAGVHWESSVLRESTNGPPRWLRFDLGADVIAMALAAALLTALVTGLLPALRTARDSVSNSLHGVRATGGGASMRLTRVLVIGEVAMSCALLIIVGTMIRGIVALDHVDLGFESSHLLSARVGLFTSTYPTGADQVRLFEKVTQRLRGDAEVVDASFATALPMRFGSDRPILPAGTAAEGDRVLPKVRYGAVDDHLLSTYGLQLLQGRFFNTGDSADGERVAVVDRRFVEHYADGGDVIGRRFRLDPRSKDGPTVTIVGVIAPLALNSPADPPQPVLLAPLRQDPARFASLVVRLRGDPNAFTPRLNAIMREIDADTPLYWVRDFDAVVREATFGEHVVAQLFAVFGLIALILAAAGLYGITAFSVGQRTREIGVRRALGAPARQILSSLFARTGWQLGIGLGVGLLIGVPFARVLTGTLHSILAHDVTTPFVVLLVLGIAATAAIIVPAQRALRINPTLALRHE